MSRSHRRRIDLGRPQRGTGPAGPFEQAVHGAAEAGRFGVAIGDGSDGRRRERFARPDLGQCRQPHAVPCRPPNKHLRRELRRVLNRGEAVNALKRAIYTGRVSPAQAKRVDEMQAVADALSLLANIVMAWNTAQMQAVLDRWANRRQVIPPELIGRIAPTRLEGINLRGVFRFPIERYAAQLLPSQTAAKTSASG